MLGSADSSSQPAIPAAPTTLGQAHPMDALVADLVASKRHLTSAHIAMLMTILPAEQRVDGGSTKQFSIGKELETMAALLKRLQTAAMGSEDINEMKTVLQSCGQFIKLAQDAQKGANAQERQNAMENAVMEAFKAIADEALRAEYKRKFLEFLHKNLPKVGRPSQKSD